MTNSHDLIFNAISQSSKCIGVIAGTKTDTQFGLNYLENHDIKGVGLPISTNPQSQTQLQVLDKEALTQLVLDSLHKLADAGADCAMIYCNSLSGAIDLERVKQSSELKVVSPLDVYEELTHHYRNFGLLAANCQSCANIERTILKFNATAKVIGIGNLQMVEDIEAGLDPDLIVDLHAMEDLVKALVKSGVQILILGCTHFDYFFEQLKQRSDGIRLFLPSERMLEILTA